MQKKNQKTKSIVSNEIMRGYMPCKGNGDERNISIFLGFLYDFGKDNVYVYQRRQAYNWVVVAGVLAMQWQFYRTIQCTWLTLKSKRRLQPLIIKRVYVSTLIETENRAYEGSHRQAQKGYTRVHLVEVIHFKKKKKKTEKKNG